MIGQNGATSVAEDKYAFKTDVSLVFGNQSVTRNYVLRTTLHSLSVWKTRNYAVAMSPFEDRSASVSKEAALIDNETWTFGVDATNANDVASSVKFAANFYDVSPEVLLANIYAKNLNAENIDTKNDEVKIRANKELYSSTCEAIRKAASILGVSCQMNFYVFSKSNNPKIPRSELSDALIQGGASSVATDEFRPKVQVGNNSGTASLTQRTNFHLATL
ncbi:hypothetical protein [Microbulbifer sp. ALW1]|uniref:hypothetical protein n=1 Tax=Microbulbifer sp. (strain ALW1) TaxID=1516059 RepID=UPI0013589B32|nr:hypothetical protein [Microbulbifer sp. ALW1]